MSTNRKILKVISIIGLVLDIILLICGIVLFMGISMDPDGAIDIATKNPIANFTGQETVGMLLGASVAAVIYGIWDCFVSFMGIRGANNPSKMGFVTVIAGISLAITVIGTIAGIVAGSFDFGDLFQVAFEGVFFYICYMVREEGKKQA